MQIILYKNFAKKDNSTKQPDNNVLSDTFECVLKDNTSVTDPVVVLDLADKVNFTKYTYAYIPIFGRYYFVIDMVSDGLLWDVVLRCDVLATYKSDIGSSSLYVLRCAAASDGRIIDNYYPLMIYHTVGYTEGTTPWIRTSNQINVELGSFVIGIVNDPTDMYGHGTYGSVTYYVLNQQNMKTLLGNLLANTITSGHGFSTDDMTLQLQKAIIDPLQFIKSCVWFPIDYSSIPGSAEFTTLRVWDWMISANCKIMTKNPPYSIFNSVNDIHKHPWTDTRGAYMNVAPYTKLRYVIPPFGMFDLDTALCYDATQVRSQITLDYITGLGTCDIKANNVTMHRIKSQVGVPIQLSQVAYDYIGSLSSGVSGFVGATASLMAGSVSGVMNGITTMIGSAVNAFIPNQSTVGGNGGFSELDGTAKLYYEHYYPVDEDNTNAGRPLCEIRQLSTLPGYQLIMDGDVTIAGTAGEQAMIKSYLEGGYYYE